MALRGDLPLPETRAIVQEAYLHIVKPSFERGLKWEAVFNGNRISVAMNDEDFLQKIDQGERFAQGDGLSVALAVEQVLDPSVRTYLNRSYSVERVFQHIPRPEQSAFEFPSPSAVESNEELRQRLIRLLSKGTTDSDTSEEQRTDDPNKTATS